MRRLSHQQTFGIAWRQGLLCFVFIQGLDGVTSCIVASWNLIDSVMAHCLRRCRCSYTQDHACRCQEISIFEFDRTSFGCARIRVGFEVGFNHGAIRHRSFCRRFHMSHACTWLRRKAACSCDRIGWGWVLVEAFDWWRENSTWQFETNFITQHESDHAIICSEAWLFTSGPAFTRSSCSPLSDGWCLCKRRSSQRPQTFRYLDQGSSRRSVQAWWKQGWAPRQ